MKRAFTLIELSIVLIIIGLIIGAVVTGKNLINQSKMVTVLSEKRKFEAAINNFEQVHRAFPGDLSDATDYFPSAAGNGNGNNITIGRISDEPNEEDALFWNHLALSGDISGSYVGTGLTDNIAGASVSGGIIPGSGVGPNYGWTISMKLWELGADRTRSCVNYGRSGLLSLAITDGSSNFVLGGDSETGGGGFTAKQVYNLELKVDDGDPRAGIIQTRLTQGAGGHAPENCRTGPAEPYDVGNPIAGCPICFILRD